MQLVKLEKISPKRQWSHEEHDFTPWLADNLQDLGDVIGYDLEFVAREVPVGPYWADILAKDLNSDVKVVIENQLEKTNHDHMGKCITYSSVLDAKIIIWISPQFTDEHKKAMEWLNDNTPSELSFYAIELSLLKIDDDKASVVFDVVVAPNEVVKVSKEAQKQVSPTGEKQLAFWTKFREAISDFVKHPQSARPQYWFNIAVGKSGICVSNTYNTNNNEIGCSLYVGNAHTTTILPYLESRKEEIEKNLGFSMEWNPNPNNKDKVIIIKKVFDMESDKGRGEALEWLKSSTEKVLKVFSKAIKEYKG